MGCGASVEVGTSNVDIIKSTALKPLSAVCPKDDLFQAAFNGDLEEMQRLLQYYEVVCDWYDSALIYWKENVNDPDEKTGRTLLHWACINKEAKAEVFDFLIKQGADIEARSAEGLTTAMIAGIGKLLHWFSSC